MCYENQMSVAITAAKIAGDAILEIYKTDFEDSVQYKDDKSPLTIADTASNNCITEILSKEFPDIPVLSEESLDDPRLMESKICWVVDPLDGTKEFIKRNGEFTVNIALCLDGDPIVGVIYVPVTQTLYYAAEAIGAFKEQNGIKTKIHVSDKINDLILVGSKSHASEDLQLLIQKHQSFIRETISAGSSLKGTMVAEGIADIYYRFGYTSEWDTAAMHCIVEQSGGIFRQMDGTKMTYNRTNHLNEKGFYIVNKKENIWV